MRRFIVGCSLTALAGALMVGCSSDRVAAPSAVTTPHQAVSAAASAQAVTCPTYAQTAGVIAKVFPFPSSLIAYAGWLVVLDEYAHGRVSAAQTLMFKLWGPTLTAYKAGKLIGGVSMGTAANVLAFGDGLYCDVGLNPTGLTLGSDPTNPANVVAVVFPSPDSQTVKTNDGQAAVTISPKAITNPVTITISYITTTYGPFAGPLATPLDQYGPFFEFDVTPAGAFSDTVVVQQCLTPPGASSLPIVPATVHLGHNVTTGGTTVAQILPFATSSLSCNSSSAVPQATPYELARAGQIGRAARALGSDVLALFEPTVAYAASTSLGVGGKTKSFSPYGGIDTTLVIATQPSPFPVYTVPTGTPDSLAPAVLVSTPNGHTPIPGATVTFAVTAGQGDLTPTGSTTQSSSVVVATGTNGIAATGSWIVGPGANTVTGTAVYPVPSGSVGVTVLGPAPTFQANGTDILPYADSSGYSGGYSYLVPADNPTIDTTGFAQATYSPAGWASGVAPFGGPIPNTTGTSCPLFPLVQTAWDNSVEPSILLLRRPFVLPASFTGSVQIGIAIDNDVQVYFNGQALTSPTTGQTPDASGFFEHGGCASDNTLVFSIPNSSLVLGGSNLLALRARDDGVLAYVDVQVLPIASGNQNSMSVHKLKALPRR